ncbi:MAG: CHAT domain-containing protein [Bernardetiaceae bacterium]|nr:CHAT domain-containing protein [Bernardetiaceae bacterium]
MQKTPVVFTAFANDPGNYLHLLEKEEDALQKILMPLDSQDKIKHVNRGRSETASVFEVLNSYSGRVKIFHYGGHAGSDFLELQDQIAYMDGLADRLIEENKKGELLLVFFNGCSTYENVRRLLQGGIAAVIATTTPIDDDLATTFSIEFYKNLAAEQDIETAYKNAAAYARTIAKDERVTQLGAVNFWNPQAQDAPQEPEVKSDFPWALYVRAQDVLKNKKIIADEPSLIEGADKPVQNGKYNATELLDMIEEGEIDELLDIFADNKKDFKGFQAFRDEYLYDAPKGRDLMQFKKRLAAFVGKSLKKLNS